MDRLVPIKPKKLISILKKNGFRLIHVKGSHHVFKHEDGRRVVIPVHSGKLIGKGLFLKIIKEELKMSKEDFFGSIK